MKRIIFFLLLLILFGCKTNINTVPESNYIQDKINILKVINIYNETYQSHNIDTNCELNKKDTDYQYTFYRKRIDQEGENSFLFENAIMFSDINLCKKIDNIPQKSFCYAIVLENISYCGATQSIVCKSILSRNINHCNKTNDFNEQQECIGSYKFFKAFYNDDFNICKSINEIDKKYGCLAIFSKQNEKEYQKEKCTDNFYQKLATTTGNAYYCTLLKDETQKNECLDLTYIEISHHLNFEAYEKGKIILGKKWDDFMEDNHHKTALKMNNTQYCFLIENIQNQNKCIDNVNFNHFKTEFHTSTMDCMNFATTHYQDVCNLDKGRNKNNISYCSIINNSDMKNTCHSIVLKNTTYCKKVNNTKYKQICKDIYRK